MELSHNTALQQTPERFDIVGVDLTAHILALSMRNGFMPDTARLQEPVTGVLIGSYQIHLLADRFAHEPIQNSCIGILDDSADDISFPADRANDAYLAALLATAT
jgi:hypothetical protein